MFCGSIMQEALYWCEEMTPNAWQLAAVHKNNIETSKYRSNIGYTIYIVYLIYAQNDDSDFLTPTTSNKNCFCNTVYEFPNKVTCSSK